MEYLQKIFPILKKAGEKTIKLQSTVESKKKEDNTWVTNADEEIELFLKQELKKIEPKATFVGEETKKEHSSFMWLVDPIDGTKAYKQGMEDYAIVISLIKNNEATLGAVYKPTTKQLFYAEKGKGSYLIEKNKRIKLQVSKRKKLQECIYIYDYRNKEPMRTVMSEIFDKTLTPLVEHRYVKSPASVGICELAKGSIDIVTYPGLGPWDIAGPSLILEEAKGKWTDFYGKSSKEGPSFLGTNKVIHEEVLKHITKKYKQILKRNL
ncbi:MAG: inositol monophosphatase [bacterium]|nr:inositol monophosphatase [bacterium]